MFGQPIVGTNFIAQLLYETTPGNFTAHPETANFYSDTRFQGWWNGGDRTLTGAGGDLTSVRMQVRAWDGAQADPSQYALLTFEDAVAAGNQWGVSGVFTYLEFLSGAPSPSDYWMKNFQGFSLVPEPSAWALFALGMGWLVWRRRRLR